MTANRMGQTIEGRKLLADEFRGQIRRAWTDATSADPDEWSIANPARGQCAVTALLVQELLGGKLMRSEIDGLSHYYNQLPSGQILDLTREQFGDRIKNETPGETRSRTYVLSFPETRRRLKLLRSRFRETLASEHTRI